MTVLEKLKEYIEKRLAKIQAEIEKNNKNQEIMQTADEILSNTTGFINGEINLEDIPGIDGLFKIVYKEKSETQFVRFQKLISFFKESKEIFNRDNLPQFKRYIEEYRNVTKEISKVKGFLEMKIFESNRRVEREYEEFKKFDSIIQNGKIVNHLSDEESYKEFCDFILNTDLDETEKFELIKIVSKDTIEYQKSLPKIKTAEENVQVKRNARRATRRAQVQAPAAVQVQETETEGVSLSDEDKLIVSKIDEILAKFKEDEVEPSMGARILANDFSTDFRKTVYESDDNIWETMHGDIVLNLYPNLTTENKDYIIAVFAFIINTYEMKYGKQKTRNVADYDVLQAEKERLDEIYELAKEEKTALDNLYSSLSNDDKQRVDAAYYYLSIGEEANANLVNSIISVKELKKVKECINFIEAYDDYRNNIKSIAEFSDISDEELRSYMESIVSRVKLSADLLEHMNSEETMDEITTKEEDIEDALKGVSDNIETSPIEDSKSLDINTWMTYLPNPKTGETYGMEDILELDNSNSDEIKVANALKRMYGQTLAERRTSGDNAKIKYHKGKGGLNYERIIHPYRMRSGITRTAYCEIPIAEKNQEILAERLNTDKNVNIVLILGLFTKRTSDNELYAEVNKRISNNIKTIREIRQLFSDDFKNEEDVEKAVSLINDGLAIYDKTVAIAKEKESGMGEV